jgi:FkbM family methyltransferase
MIDPKSVITYAQYNEDIILAALLSETKQGFYIDIGANYPVIDSVTMLFYQRGWRGINVEPIKGLHAQLEKERPKDINLQCGVGAKQGTAEFREYTNLPGHSTFTTEQKNGHKTEEFNDYEVAIVTLNDIYKKYKLQTVDFIKIDVEGYEFEVIKGNDWVRNRPKVICIESNHITKDWRPVLKKNKYKEFINDGLNSYYIAEECWSLTHNFAEKAVELDFHALKQHQAQSWQSDSKELMRLHEMVKNLSDQVSGLQTQLQRVQPLSLKDQPLLRRIKRSVYGLTIDFARYIKHKSE